MQETSLSDLGPQCLLHVFSYLTAKECGQLYLVHPSFRDTISDDLIWKQHMLSEFATVTPVGPDNQTKESFRAAYVAWTTAFGPEYAPYLKRAILAWRSIKAYLAAPLPEALASLRPGASDLDIKQVEQSMGLSLPPAMKVLYRLHDGQELAFDRQFDEPEQEQDMDEHPSMTQGVFGGYEFYQHLTSVRMLPLNRVQMWSTFMQQNIPGQVPFAASFDFGKCFAVDPASASIRVASQDGPRLAAPEVEGARDGVLRWFEEYARRLSVGWYDVDLLSSGVNSTRGICLFPKVEPGMVSQVTRGVQVRASSIYVPEMSHRRAHVFTYSIRFSLLLPDQQRMAWPATAGPPRTLESCQLLNRHWVIRDSAGNKNDEIRGEAVVGKFPLLRPGEPEFVYQSCTNQPETKGSMEGDFLFVEGSIRTPTGPEWEVVCPRFMLEVPDFIY